ncbi:MAG: copper chaperone PCu(A)C [Pseudomonadota bacterium]
MKPRLLSALMLAAALATTGAAAHEFQLGTLKIDHPWARPTLPGQSAGGAYLGLHNGGATPDRLLGGSTPAAARVELHEMRMQGDVMRMREVPALDLAPGKPVKLAPGGLHLMLFGLKAPLKLGDKLPLKLRFEKAGEIEVMLHVENAPAAPAEAPHKH